MYPKCCSFLLTASANLLEDFNLNVQFLLLCVRKKCYHTSLLLLTWTLSTFVCSDWSGWNSYAGSKYQPDIEDLSPWEYNKMWCELLHFLRKLQYIHEISFACQFHYNILLIVKCRESIRPPLHFGQKALWILSQGESDCNLTVIPLTHSWIQWLLQQYRYSIFSTFSFNNCSFFMINLARTCLLSKKIVGRRWLLPLKGYLDI